MASTSAVDCPVCCLAFTDVKRHKVSCAYCQYEACQDCYRTYLTSSMQDAHCMQCRRTWNRDVVLSVFPGTWVNGPYKIHRERVLIDREKQLLPQSQELVANYKRARTLRASAANKKLELTELVARSNVLKRQISDETYRAERLARNGYRGTAGGNQEKRPKLEFIAPCPVLECRGFLNGDMVCGTCQTKACTRCGMALTTEHHECSADDVASFQMIRKQTKPCPKCAVPTTKASGCHQMWCTQCHTTWNWSSGAIETGVIHNPHYFQYLRQRNPGGDIPRQPGDVPGGAMERCDRRHFPHGWDVRQRLRKNGIPEAIEDRVLATLRNYIHIQEIAIPQLRHPEDENTDLRLKYLINDITERDFEIQLQRREKKRERDNAVRDVYEMVIDTSRDVLWRFVDDGATAEETVAELNAIKEYANTHLKKISSQYKMTVKYV